MNKAQALCTKCGGAMERGYLPDQVMGRAEQLAWSRGVVEGRAFVGGIKLKPEEQIPVTAYRCPDCGLIELTALPESGP
jgi:predicted RNA-binding Zn-ribbon protein involved in translation (DUF1610 family)